MSEDNSIKTQEAQNSEEEKNNTPESSIKENPKTPLQKFLEQRDVLLMLYPKNENGIFFDSIEPEDELTVYELLKKQSDNKDSLLILLDTSGGNVYSAVKIMDTLRTKYKNITIAIPQEAKSSGTMMCCGADDLIMCSISELGPLDKPMVHPDNETARISALDIVRSIDGMIDTAIERQNKLSTEISEGKAGISLHESMDIANDFISKLISPMLCKEDAKFYNQAKRLLVIAETYGSEFLTQFMLKYIKDKKLRERIANMITRRLVWLYPDHGFAIRRNELKDWFFQVEYAENLDYWDELYNEFKQNIGSKSKLIKFL